MLFRSGAGEPPESEGPASAVPAEALDARAVVLVKMHAGVQREALEEGLVSASAALDGRARLSVGGLGAEVVECVGGADVLEEVCLVEDAAHPRDDAQEQGVELGVGGRWQAHEGGVVVVLHVEDAVRQDAALASVMLKF